ncbi:endothelin-converting enzyme homolog isoform X2 [Mercenaria mercenaria]|uniref:endothelin-converting enzyme homolog isoform X2 n=1 Tax=Mercenaria mercenaria TaxID=6596 RepID=UPI00234F4B35|nr:endothelin-converting enzyme homolog isoform X2 [Mercenaria mercenaria]XP_053402260.1 endothelin-converting enzyme homolog isoform X2 [Mercenaria mercenaria]XP_053402261.1 endothelin-converting enzyme homolog isoform X2 [Mercenaria mercenaria]XP_053402262.1 endothelin-converting enzyme homolog isoform X2 [Mercenaria mercenaria]XP_053402263.1 endothelin-converting enzyme homolog isoform X2 [Mercenaria mercenaria]XP_053402264.1 endothelin-converting enzyme homolog isoform X2 [Mercenaria merce
MNEDKSDLVGNIATEYENGDSSLEKKARNRMVAEGYKYHVLEDKGEPGILDPVEDEERKKHRRQNDKLKILLVFGVILLTCLVVVIIFQHFRTHGATQICTTEECVKGSAYIVNKMDTTVDPCEDFYTFSCGNWEKMTPIPPSKSKYGSFSQIGDEIKKKLREVLEEDEKLYKGVKSSAIHKAKTFYDMCMDEKEIKKAGKGPVLKLIGELGSWGMTSDPVSGTFDPDKWDIEDAFLLTHRYGLSSLFSMGISTDEKNSGRYMIKFEQSGLTLSDSKEYFSNHTNYEILKRAYIEYATGFAKLLGAGDNVEESVRNLYDFEQKLAVIHVPREQLLDPLKTYHNMTLQQFQDDYLGDWLNLEAYVKGIFGDINTIPMDTEVLVYTPEYFTELQDLLKQTDKELLANYFVWHSVDHMVGYLTKDFLEVALGLDKAESGIKEYPVRWKRCLSKTTSAFGFAVGALYVQENFAEESKKDVESLFEEIRAAFIANLDDLEWMDDKTRAYAIEKANGVSKMLGYPDYVLDPAKLDKHYENVTLVDGKFFESKLSELIYYRQKNLRRLGTVPDRNEWNMVPSEVNGYYSADFNHIVFPAGILQPPLYNPTSPRSFNFGSFGMICGHELTHGFDNRGKDFDKEGNMRNWWTKSSTENFKKLTKCFEDFYHEYTVNGTHLNGKTTLGENIADNGGMKTAYLAYKSWLKKSGGKDIVSLPGMKYNSDQLFFIGMAQIWCSHYTPEYQQKAILVDEHSIAKYRVLGSMSNSKYFAKAFNCPKNSPMNPEEKCTVW